jgi:L-ascorbate 6-phosphate lactonase
MSEIAKTDGRGLLWGGYLNSDHPITRDVWLNEAFPEWGTYLNKVIENYEVPYGQVSLWWCGGPSWVLKTDAGGIYFIDLNCGPSHYTTYEYCGVCKQAGADSINWLRLNPHVIDPWGFKKLDGVFITHTHADHCDIYTVKAALQMYDCKFYTSPEAAKRLREFQVPEDRLVVGKWHESVQVPGTEVVFAPCYDATAIRTGGGQNLPFEQACCSFLFKTSAGNIMFLGDTWYHDAYIEVPLRYQVDVALFDMGSNAPGATDKMTPYDCARLGQILKAKVLIPDHYDNWVNCAGDPDLLCNQFERIVAENTPHIKTVIMQCAGQFNYPQDQDMKRYRYPDGSENYKFEKSVFAKDPTK